MVLSSQALFKTHLCARRSKLEKASFLLSSSTLPSNRLGKANNLYCSPANLRNSFPKPLFLALICNPTTTTLFPKMTDRQIYYFGNGHSDGKAEMKDLLGGKGANLCEMVNMGITVPPGFVISTTVCKEYEKTNDLTPELKANIEAHVKMVEKELGRNFGDASNALLFSVRSGAAASMPGMMDTVLNLGLNDIIVEAIAKKTTPSFAYDSYRRFITMYADIVVQIGRDDFEHEITELKKRLNVKHDCEIPAADLQALCTKFKALFKEKAGFDFPQEPKEQLFAAVKAVFRSWNNPRAIAYRQINNIKGLIGTAVNIQAMVFGNFNNQSATGVAFSRSPSDGTNFFYGEYLINAQGEDVVAGIRTPQQLTIIESRNWAKTHEVSEADRVAKYPSMEESMPELYKQLVDIRNKLEQRYRDMQDMEFTVENGKLWMLQCRNAKRTIRASVKCAVDMVKEGMINEEEAVLRIDPLQVDHLLHPSIDPHATPKVLAKGLAASPGAAVGQIVFNAKDAESEAAKGKKVIMVRLETSPEDLKGMAAAQGILTARGGMTSHAAVVARGMGKVCVAGVGDIQFNGEKSFSVGGKTFKEFDYITLDGSKGLVYEGQVPLVKADISGDFDTIIKWCKKYKRLGVRSNSDTPKDAQTARDFGAEGVGLCRTEHMFFEGTRIDHMRAMILAGDLAGRQKALLNILPLQKGDFVGIFKELNGQTCTIRLLDPPLHEYCPQDPKIQAELASHLGLTVQYVAERVKALEEHNPMLGLRGVRLGLVHPEIYNTQVQAIIEAAVEVTKLGIAVHPEIMIPLVGKRSELHMAREHATEAAEAVLKAAGMRVPYQIGTMIEVPRACVTADDIAQEADFFSFGTNDLTQMGCGFSRDDAALFLKRYVELGIYAEDPFKTVDQQGVGELMKMAIAKGRSVKPQLSIGVCGETGGEMVSIAFYHSIGLDYVSCSPYRVPAAIVAAAHAAIKEKKSKK
jgi:pyruvate,orthophosphate dikinase